MGRIQRRAFCIVLATVLLVGCGSAATTPSAPLSSPSGLASSASAVASQTTAVSPSPTAAASPSHESIGRPADDGAYTFRITKVDARTRDLTIVSPSLNVPAQVRLLLPARFDASPSTRWPVLYLLHGATGSHVDWTNLTDVEKLTASTNLLVVMPDAGDEGWYSDWWNDGQLGQPRWETFHLVELLQILDRNWRAGPKRAIAGLSMGGFGAMEYAARHPDLFLAAASFSGVLETEGRGLDINRDIWGDEFSQADVWNAHDPVLLASGLEKHALYVSYGDGTAGPFDNGVVPDGDFEGWIGDGNVLFVKKLHERGIPVTVDAGPGTHTWPYWQRGLHRSLPILLKALGEPVK
jgi:diacylglycerol O-acyltransferase/trehalose O-mycolyltransferase